MACNIETFAYPSWWSGATHVAITFNEGSNDYTGASASGIARADLEFLPQGVARSNGKLWTWASISMIEKED